MRTHYRGSHPALKFALAMLASGLWHTSARAELIGPGAATMTERTANEADGAEAQPDASVRLTARLNPEIAAAFRLFVYVNKAASGPGAQRMSIFARSDDGQLALLHDWPVSTGRERIEHDVNGRMQWSVTPTGYFEVDPRRVYVSHMSGQLHEPMPYAMFFAQTPGGARTGLAIHGTDDTQAALLGTRASAGCVRLSLENARTLFTLIGSQVRGPTPALARVSGNSVANPTDFLVHDAQGHLVQSDGYSVLIVIDDPTAPAQLVVSALTPPAGGNAQ